MMSGMAKPAVRSVLYPRQTTDAVERVVRSAGSDGSPLLTPVVLRRGALAAAREVLASGGRHDISGPAPEAAFFAALALLPAVLTLVAVLRVEQPAFGSDAAPRATCSACYSAPKSTPPATRWVARMTLNGRRWFM